MRAQRNARPDNNKALKHETDGNHKGPRPFRITSVQSIEMMEATQFLTVKVTVLDFTALPFLSVTMQ